jgi:hypothetical protein
MGEAKRRRERGEKPVGSAVLPVDFIQQLVDTANANDAIMDGTMKPVMELIATNDVVYGIWQDSAEPGGVGTLIVKGENRLREIAATGVSQESRITAIKCITLEQAEALRQHVGTDRTH